MIDEKVLERLLHDEADTYEVPADGPDEVLTAAAEDEDRPARRTPWLAVAAATVLVVAGVTIVRAGDTGGRGGLPAAGHGTVALVDEDNLASGGGAGEKRDPLAYDNQAPGVDSAHVERTGETWLEAPKQRVRDVLRDVARVAGTHGGYVSESDAETAGEHPRGQVTIRVPVAAYDRAAEDVAALGDVRQSTTRAEDVSKQVNDTAARLRSAVATRAQLRTLLARASDVGDVLAVQGRMDEVQTEIEKLQAAQQALKDRTTFGTLRVYVSTPGSDDTPTGFARAWDQAVDGFVGGFQALVAMSGTLAFALIVGAVLFLLARRAYRFWVRGVV